MIKISDTYCIIQQYLEALVYFLQKIANFIYFTNQYIFQQNQHYYTCSQVFNHQLQFIINLPIVFNSIFSIFIKTSEFNYKSRTTFDKFIRQTLYYLLLLMQDNNLQDTQIPVFQSFISFSSTKNHISNSTCNNSLLRQTASSTDHHNNRFTDQLSPKTINPFDLHESKSVQIPKLGERYHYKSKLTKKPLVDHFQVIENTLKDQNINLKQQNNLLLAEIQRLRQSNKKYLNQKNVQRLKIQQMREQSLVHQNTVEQLKDIALHHFPALEAKVGASKQNLKDINWSDILNTSDQLSK